VAEIFGVVYEFDDDNKGVIAVVLAYQSITDPVDGVAFNVADPVDEHDVIFAGIVDTTEGKLFTVVVMAFEVAVVLVTSAAFKLVVITTLIKSLFTMLFSVNVAPVPTLSPFFLH
jgi:hypothetical protein